jgi:hypothetical protein
MRSFCHNVAVYPQPTPRRNPGGDCFACALTAALRHFFPDEPPAFDHVFDCFMREQTEPSGEKRSFLNNTWPGMRTAIYSAHNLVGSLQVFADIVVPRDDPERWSHDWGPQADGYAWARRLDAWLRSGHIALASILYAGNPTGEWVQTPDGPRRHATDHFVLFDGVRCGWKRHGDGGGGTLTYQVHVVCSAAGGRTYWIDVDQLLREHGAGAWWLLRPTDFNDLVEAA